MVNDTVVLLGKLPVESLVLDLLAGQFGWSFENAASFDCLRAIGTNRNVLAVLFEASMWGLTWGEALQTVRAAAPNARPILCHRFSDTILWPELSAEGAFHALPIPFNTTELQQGLGFLWAAVSPRAAVVPLNGVRHKWPATSLPNTQVRVAGNVA